MPGGSEYYVLLLYDLVMTPLHMRAQSLLDVWMPKEGNHGSRQGTPESVLQSYKKRKKQRVNFDALSFFPQVGTTSY